MTWGDSAHDIVEHRPQPARAARPRVGARVAVGVVAVVVAVVVAALLAEYGPWHHRGPATPRPAAMPSAAGPAAYVDPLGAAADPTVDGWTASASPGRLSVGFRVSSRQHDPMTVVAVRGEAPGATLAGVTTEEKAGRGQAALAATGAVLRPMGTLPVRLDFALPGDGCRSVGGSLSLTLYIRYHDRTSAMALYPSGPWPQAYERATGCTGADPRVPSSGTVVVPLRHGRGSAVLGTVGVSPKLHITINCSNGEYVWLDLGSTDARAHLFCTGRQQDTEWAMADGLRTVRLSAGSRVRWAIVVWRDDTG